MKYSLLLLSMAFAMNSQASCTNYYWSKAADTYNEGHRLSKKVLEAMDTTVFYEADTVKDFEKVYKNYKQALTDASNSIRKYEKAAPLWRELYYDCDGENATNAKKYQKKAKERVEIVKQIKESIENNKRFIPSTLAKIGDVSLAKRIRSKENIDLTREDDGDYPITTASMRENIDYVKYLISIGSKVNVPGESYSYSPINAATFKLNKELFDLVIDYYDTFPENKNFSDEYGNATDFLFYTLHMVDGERLILGEYQEEKKRSQMLLELYKRGLFPSSDDGMLKLKLYLDKFRLDNDENDSMETATEVKESIYSFGNIINSTDDVDYITFTLKEKKRVSINLLKSGMIGNELLLEILDKEGNILGRDYSTLTSGELVGEVEAGKYYIRVKSDGNTVGPYTLDIQL